MKTVEREYYILQDTMAILPGRENVEYFGFKIEEDSGPDWTTGLEFSDDDKPKEPIKIQIASVEDEEEGEPADPISARLYPELSFYPLPLFSKQIVDIFKQGGALNFQTFATEITNLSQDKLEKQMYLAVNIIGLFTPDNIRKDVLIFRLVGAKDFIIVHKTLKQKVEEAGMIQITWSPVKILPSITNTDGSISQLPLITLP